MSRSKSVLRLILFSLTKFALMNTQKSQRVFRGTVALVIAAASIAVSLPTQAKPFHNNVSQAPANEVGNIVEVAASNPNFKTLVAAVKAADLVETLSGPGPFTVFAPTEAAFKKLPKGTLNKLLLPENKEKLKQILTYHVVSGAVESKTLKSGKVETVEGGSLKVVVRKGKGGITVNKSKVIKADIKASNGVIHVIDTVLLPPEK
jgi:uncharacterized surface protein with fasciclin (FAS1) repeats